MCEILGHIGDNTLRLPNVQLYILIPVVGYIDWCWGLMHEFLVMPKIRVTGGHFLRRKYHVLRNFEQESLLNLTGPEARGTGWRKEQARHVS